MTDIPDAEELAAAEERIAPYVHRTRVTTNRALDDRVNADVFLKCEHEQRAGSFKIRGAVNHIVQLSEKEQERGVVAHSSGNHAQAVACAGQRFGVPVTIVMPENSNPVKLAATKGYGARVVLCQDTQAAREETADRIVQETGGVLIHPNAVPKTIEGAATATMELLDEVSDLDLVITPIGGGGLGSGAALACRYFSPETVFVGAEPKGADDAARSLATGTLVTEQTPHTIADGLRTCLGELNFRILSDTGTGIVTVTEEEIVEAMRFVWERAKLPIEPSSAVAVAAMTSGNLDVSGKRVGVVLSGGNVDLSRYFDGLIAGSA